MVKLNRRKRDDIGGACQRLGNLVLHLEQTVEQQRVKGAALTVQNHLDRFLVRDSVLVHAHARQGIVHVGHRNHLCGNGNFVALKAIGITLAVPALVVPTRNLVRIFHKRIAGVMATQLTQHVGADRGMRLHNLELLGRKASGLVENRIVNRHLADIVQRRSQGDRGAFLIVEGDRAATLDQTAKQQLGQLLDVRNVPAALAVAKLHDAGHDIDEHATVLDALVVLLGQQARQTALFGV